MPQEASSVPPNPCAPNSKSTPTQCLDTDRPGDCMDIDLFSVPVQPSRPQFPTPLPAIHLEGIAPSTSSSGDSIRSLPVPVADLQSSNSSSVALVDDQMLISASLEAGPPPPVDSSIILTSQRIASLTSSVGNDDGNNSLPVWAAHLQSDNPPPTVSAGLNAASSQVATPNRTETCYVVFQNLPSGTTVHDIAKNLHMPVHCGGCGITILSSAPLPSFDAASSSFVLQLGSIREACIAAVGWKGISEECSIIPAPDHLVATVTFTPYVTPGVPSLPLPNHPQSYSNSPASHVQGHSSRRASIRYPSTSQSSLQDQPVGHVQQTHNFRGYWMRKGHQV